ncbi:hypothetical protein [Nocardia sp. NPDC003963]
MSAGARIGIRGPSPPLGECRDSCDNACAWLPTLYDDEHVEVALEVEVVLENGADHMINTRGRSADGVRAVLEGLTGRPESTR